jgi:hypothetical protein
MNIEQLKQILDKFPDDAELRVTVKLGDDDYFSTVELTDYIFRKSENVLELG